MKQFLAIVFSLFAVSAVAAPGGADRARNFDSAYGARALFSDPGERAAAEYRLFHSFPSPYGASTPAYWLRSDYFYSDLGSTLCTNGQKVEQASDVSGNGVNFVQATSGNRPTFTTGALGSYASATFVSANSQYLQNASSLVPKTLLVVGRLNTTSTGAYEDYFGVQSASPGSPPYCSIEMEVCRGDTSGMGTAMADTGDTFHTALQQRSYGGQFYIQAYRYDGSTLQTEVNTVATATVTSSSTRPPGGPTVVGSSYYSSVPAGFLDGDIVEVLAYSTRLSDSEIAQVYTALKNRYWPIVSPGTYNLTSFSSAKPSGTLAAGTLQEYARFFTSSDGLTFSETPFSIIPTTITSTCREWSMWKLHGTFYAAINNWQPTTTQRSFEILSSDRCNGPFGHLCYVDCSALASGSASQVWEPIFFHDPVSGSNYITFTYFVSGGISGSGQPGYVQALDATMKNWGTATAVGGFPALTSNEYSFYPLYVSGTYYGFYVDLTGGQENVRLANSSSLWTGYTAVGNSFGYTANSYEDPTPVYVGGAIRLYLSVVGGIVGPVDYSNSTNLNLNTATWGAGAGLSGTTGLGVVGSNIYLPALDPPSSSGSSLTTTGVGAVLRAPWGWIDDLWIEMDVLRAA